MAGETGRRGGCDQPGMKGRQRSSRGKVESAADTIFGEEARADEATSGEEIRRAAGDIDGTTEVEEADGVKQGSLSWAAFVGTMWGDKGWKLCTSSRKKGWKENKSKMWDPHC